MLGKKRQSPKTPEERIRKLEVNVALLAKEVERLYDQQKGFDTWLKSNVEAIRYVERKVDNALIDVAATPTGPGD